MSFSGQKVLITGGTGFIGKALCAHLIDGGAQLTVLTRKARISDAKIQYIQNLNDLNDEDVFDVVINLAGEPIAQRWTKKAKARILNSRVETTKALIEYFERTHQKPKLFISGSAIGWYGTSETESFDETSKPLKNSIGDFARQVCYEWETEALKAKEMGVRTVLLRIGVVLEKDGGTLAKLLPPFYLCGGGPIGHGRQPFSWIHRDDLICIIERIIIHANIEGVVNGTAPVPVSNKKFSTALGRAIKRPAFLPLPAFVLKIMFGQMAEEIMLNGQIVLPTIIQGHGYRFCYPDIDAALGSIFKK